MLSSSPGAPCSFRPICAAERAANAKRHFTTYHANAGSSLLAGPKRTQHLRVFGEHSARPRITLLRVVRIGPFRVGSNLRGFVSGHQKRTPNRERYHTCLMDGWVDGEKRSLLSPSFVGIRHVRRISHFAAGL
jgi:hypothetical protein